MKRDIPIYFDNAVIMSSPERIGSSNMNRLDVGVFTKYGNRNGSYIKDDVADMLITSASMGDTPVVGFFDPESQGWASHTGPKLASAYGYVESFKGWQPFTDKDGETRDYAVFSVVLFNKYFDEANYIKGSNQSMELDINSIEGDWADIDGHEYFVYTKAEIMGLCIIGAHEPCFSVSSFFAKQDEQYKSQYDKFSSLLADLKAQVEEAERQPEGGEHQMENEMNPEVNESTPAQNEPAIQEPAAPAEFNAEEEANTEPASNEEDSAQEPAAEPQNDSMEEPEPAAEPAVDFEAQINELQEQIRSLTANYEQAQNRIAELEAQITSASEVETSLRNEIATYAAERAHAEEERRNSLIERYEALLTEEDINPIREAAANFSYDELESKLAICYANKQMAGSEEPIVPLSEPAVDQFALFMEKYRKN